MTEGHESDFLVTVRAQVMTRDESTEGWLPLAGGGLANVSIRKRARLSPGAAGHEYIIYGQRISDQSVILSCVINRDLKYFKVMPTFHHWRAGKQRNGLTFQTAADARAFDKGVVRAYNELIDGLAKLNPLIVCSPLTKYDSVGEDDVFMTLDLPVESDGIQQQQQQQQQQQNYQHSSPEGSERSQKSVSDRGERNRDSISLKSQSHNDKHEKPAPIHYISSEKSSIQTPALTGLTTTAGTKNPSIIEQTPPTIAASENYSYVTLTAVHDYNYPVVDQPAAAQVLNARRESISALKKRNAALEAATQALAAQQHSSPISTYGGVGSIDRIGDLLKDPSSVTAAADMMIKKKNNHQTRVRCRYCHEFYNDEWNRKGACEFAPDCFRSGFECISGMGCANCMLYHCMSDAEGETPAHPCECVNEAGCTKRWIGLTLLSLVVPCLWCYPPLRACHWVGVSCGICGGKHKPQV